MPAPRNTPRTSPRIPRIPHRDHDHKYRIRGKLAKAIDLLVFQGMQMETAAKAAGMRTYSLRQAFGRAHVIAYLRQRREVFRTVACGANVKRLCDIRDAAANIPAVQAIGMLERMDSDPVATRATSATPGLVIIVQGGATKPAATVEHEPQRALDVRTIETPSDIKP